MARGAIARLDRARGCLLGLAAGDAVGTTVEFMRRGEFEPVEDMVGGGPFGLEPGEWTDDTSLALCLAESLVCCRGFDARDQAERYARWFRTGRPGPRDGCFDIGHTTQEAVLRFVETGDPFSGSTDPGSAGNGSLMRLAAVPIFFGSDLRAAVEAGGESSRVTHGAAESVDACRAYALILVKALEGATRDEILAAALPKGQGGRDLSPAVAAVVGGRWRGKTEDEIRGSGYVVESLEAALWCFATTLTFEEAILQAANLGHDADTTAAITGQLAGAFYGRDAIPARWRERLFMGAEIDRLASELHRMGRDGQAEGNEN